MIRRVKKRFDLLVTVANSTVPKSFELDKSIVAIRGLLFTADKDELLYFRGSQKVEINKKEYFPEDYESKLLMSGINLTPNCRYYRLGKVDPGNGIIKVEYKDQNDGRTTFEVYRVSLYIDCDMEEDQ